MVFLHKYLISRNFLSNIAMQTSYHTFPYSLVSPESLFSGEKQDSQQSLALDNCRKAKRSKIFFIIRRCHLQKLYFQGYYVISTTVLKLIFVVFFVLTFHPYLGDVGFIWKFSIRLFQVISLQQKYIFTGLFDTIHGGKMRYIKY